MSVTEPTEPATPLTYQQQQKLPFQERWARETIDQYHLRRIATSTTVIAWVVVIFAILTLVGVIIQAVDLAHVQNVINQLNNGGGSGCVPGVTC
jgi:hypothetical protein